MAYIFTTLEHGAIIPVADGETVQIQDLQISRVGDNLSGPIYSEIPYESHTLYGGECVYYTKFGDNIRLMIGSSHPEKNLRAAEHFISGITIDRLERYIREKTGDESVTTHFEGSMYLECNHATFRMIPKENGVRILVYTDFVRPGHHHWDVCDMVDEAFMKYIYEREEEYSRQLS